MVSISVDKEPADIKVIIFFLFFSFEGFTISRDTIIHITIEAIATIVITSVDIFHTSLFDTFLNDTKHDFVIPYVRIKGIKVSQLSN